jgi:hypothetical protein
MRRNFAGSGRLLVPVADGRSELGWHGAPANGADGRRELRAAPGTPPPRHEASATTLLD